MRGFRGLPWPPTTPQAVLYCPKYPLRYSYWTLNGAASLRMYPPGSRIKCGNIRGNVSLWRGMP